MQTTKTTEASPFAGLLTTQFISAAKPVTLNSSIETIKDRAALLSLTIYDPKNKDLHFTESNTFGSRFSQEQYGAGFTKGLSILWAYLICLDEAENELTSPEVSQFAEKVRQISKDVLSNLKDGETALSGVRKQAEQIDNFGGYYNTVGLQADTLKNIVPEGTLNVAIEIDPYSGHLVAKLPTDLSSQLLDNYRSEIESHLTEEGKQSLGLPANTGFVVIMYKDELTKISQDEINQLLDKRVDLSFNKPYVVPVRGDNRYSLVASITMDSNDITVIRENQGLQSIYSEGRPLRVTFAAVRNPYLSDDENTLIPRLNNSKSLNDWMHLATSV